MRTDPAGLPQLRRSDSTAAAGAPAPPAGGAGAIGETGGVTGGAGGPPGFASAGLAAGDGRGRPRRHGSADAT